MKAAMLRTTLLALSRQRRLRQWVEQSGWGRRLSRRFVAGLTLEEALAAVRALQQRKLAASLDPLGEHVTTPAAAAQAAGRAIAVIAAVAASGAGATVSVKLTQLGLDLDPALAAAQLRRVLEAARTHGVYVRVDMEGSSYTDATLALVEQSHAAGWPVGTVLQASLRRTPADLERLLAQGIGVRLVKGAYREPAALAWQRKSVVDGNYLRLLRRLLDAAPALDHPPAVATHDARLLAAAQAHARQRGLPPQAFEFQLLYGIRRDLQRRLQAEGWRVRIYVPFGPAWYPYFMRRLAERPANLLFLLRNLGH